MDSQGRIDTNGKDYTIALAMGIIVDATTEVTFQNPDIEVKPPKMPFGVDPQMWREKHGLTKPKRTQLEEEAPDWEGAPTDDGLVDWTESSLM
jgi:hypothetical protein